MNKIIIGLIVIVGIGLVAWLVLTPKDMVVEQQYSINDEVEELEAELEAVEAAVAAGTLTPQDAAAAQARISTRLETIAGVSAQAQSSVTLTPAQRTQLAGGLDRLRAILLTYQATLQVVDEQTLTLPPAERPQLFRGRAGVRDAIAVAVEEVEVVLGGPAVDIEVETEGGLEVEGGDETVVPDVSEGDVVEEEEIDVPGEVEGELEGEVELETATSN